MDCQFIILHGNTRKLAHRRNRKKTDRTKISKKQSIHLQTWHNYTNNSRYRRRRKNFTAYSLQL